MSAPDPSTTVHIIGVPLDHGAGRRGVGMGPTAIRLAGLDNTLHRLGLTAKDHGDLLVPSPETQTEGAPNAKYLPTIAATCRDLCAAVTRVLDQRGLPLVLGGDHSIAVGTISGLVTDLRATHGDAAPQQLGVLWFDAHADINTPQTTHSGNIHGMPVSCLMGRGPDELTRIGFPGPKLVGHRVVQIGLRDIDAQERVLLREAGITVFTMSDIDRLGMSTVMERAIALATDGTSRLHLSFDVDVLDPEAAPGTGTPSLGGITYREAHLALEMIAETRKLTSLEIVEVNPILDDRNRTAELAVGLCGSALGQRIL